MSSRDQFKSGSNCNTIYEMQHDYALQIFPEDSSWSPCQVQAAQLHAARLCSRQPLPTTAVNLSSVRKFSSTSAATPSQHNQLRLACAIAGLARPEP
jgi:hypothetical protein